MNMIDEARNALLDAAKAEGSASEQQIRDLPDFAVATVARLKAMVETICPPADLSEEEAVERAAIARDRFAAVARSQGLTLLNLGNLPYETPAKWAFIGMWPDDALILLAHSLAIGAPRTGALNG